MFCIEIFFLRKEKIHENRRIVSLNQISHHHENLGTSPDLSSYQHSKVSVNFVLKHLVKPNESRHSFLDNIIMKKEVDEYSSERLRQNA